MTENKESQESQAVEEKPTYENLIVNKQFGNRLMDLTLKTGVFNGNKYKTVIVTSANCTVDGSPITKQEELANGQFAPVIKSQTIQIPVEAFQDFIGEAYKIFN